MGESSTAGKLFDPAVLTRAALCSLLVLLPACHGGSGGCMFAVTGAITATGTCRSVTGAYTASQDTTTFSLMGGDFSNATDTHPGLNLGASFSGMFHTGTVDSAHAIGGSGAQLSGASSTWVAVALSRGSWTLSVSDLGAQTANEKSQGVFTSPSGTFDAMLVDSMGTAAPAQLHIDF
jgi:hypothetical protein